jgi:MYXO-CTERM domain-containing protein
MKCAHVSKTVQAGVLALSLFLLPLTTTTLAQTTSPTPEAPRLETRAEDDDNTGLWGLLGLAGLFGLAGLRRRPAEKVAAYDRREQGRT